ncbi:hypothetical protein PanJK_00905 [Pantoea sp. JK]|nr:hypothetical protein [Pantoea sp. JK]
MKSAKVSDWDLFGLLSNKTVKELDEEAKKAKEDEHRRSFNALAESIKEAALKGKNNGK